MENIGIDVHKKESQLCIITEAGEVLELRIRTERGRFKEVLGARGKAKVLMEASTESWAQSRRGRFGFAGAEAIVAGAALGIGAGCEGASGWVMRARRLALGA